MDGSGKETKELSLNPKSPVARVPARLVELGDQRIAEMDAAGIDMQILSLNAPGVEQLDKEEAVRYARETNDYLASAIDAYPKRFAGFAALPLRNRKLQRRNWSARSNNFIL